MPFSTGLPKALLSNFKCVLPWFLKSLIAILIVNVVGKAIYNVYFHPLKSYPGPWLAKATPFPYVWHIFNGDIVSWTTKLHLEYGNVVRVEANELSFTSPSAWSEIFLSRPLLPRPAIGTVDNVNGVRPIIHELKTEDHLRQRRVLIHGFSSKALKMQEYILHRYADLLLQRFGEFATSGTEIDISDWYQYICFDTIGDLVYGQSFGSLEKSTYHPWVSTLFAGIKAVSFMGALTYFPMLGLLGYCIPLPLKNLLRLPMYRHFQYSVDHVDKRLKRKTERPDIMKFVLDHNHPGGLSQDELYTQMQFLVLAGSGPTAATLSAATWFVLKNPAIMRRLKQEIRDAFKTPEEIDVASASKLPYLHAVIKEALRMHPPGPTSNPRLTDRHITVDGHVVPPGVRAGIPQQTSYYLPWNFKDPYVFAPERWLPEGDTKYASDKKDMWEPFMVGQRNCMGKSLAWAEMNLILSKIFWTFDLELTADNVEDWTKQKIFLTHEKIPLMVRIHRR